MSKERELLKEACDLLDDYWKGGKTSNRNRKLFYEIKELLAQPEQEQEPVANEESLFTADAAAKKLFRGLGWTNKGEEK